MEKSPKKIEVSKIHEAYPTLLQRGLGIEQLEALVEWDVIGGIPATDEDECFVFTETLELFLRYHNDFYKYRNEALAQGLENLKVKKQSSEPSNSKIDKFGESQ